LATPIITDGSLDRAPKAPRVVLPGGRPDLFAERAVRFDALADGHPLADYLRLMAEIARGQQAALAAGSAGPVAAAVLAASRDYGMPPLSAQSHERQPQWRGDLAAILSHVRARSANGVATLDRLSRLDDAALESLADRVLAGTTLDDDAGFVPFIGAALQTYFARLAATLDPASVEHCDVPGICPVCASRPVASVVRIGGDLANLRYLVCSLCATEWNLARIKCTSCDTDKGLQYLALKVDGRESTDSSARAEACDECKSYLKIFYQEKDVNLEPNADDLATLALDVLVDEQGYARSGPNLLFHPGSG
jgi:FdhE protein